MLYLYTGRPKSEPYCDTIDTTRYVRLLVSPPCDAHNYFCVFITIIVQALGLAFTVMYTIMLIVIVFGSQICLSMFGRLIPFLIP